MLSLIPLLFAGYNRGGIAGEIENLNKCTISGKVITTEITNIYEDNCDIIQVTTSGDEGEYQIITYAVAKIIYPKNPAACVMVPDIYWYPINYPLDTIPKIGDSVNFLVDKDTYKIISGDRTSNGEYKLNGGYSSEGNFEICEPNVGEDTELQKKIRNGHTYLNELYNTKPKLVKSLLKPLKQAVLSDKLEIEIRNLASAFWKIVNNL